MNNSIIMKTATLTISSSNSIPDEIIVFEILKRLPVKTLCRFRAVSKRWLSIINSRLFIDSHLQHSKLNPTRLFVFYNKDTTTQHPPIIFSTNYPQTSSYKLQNQCLSSISPRGLICFYGIHDDDTIVHIWNPSTGEHIEVSRPELGKRCPVFLGFDPVCKKHKLLSFSDGENYVFTLGEKNWRKLARNLTPLLRRDCCIDGIIYYLVRTDQKYVELVLVRFDVGSESFLELIHLPEFVRFPRVYFFTLRIYVYRGRVILVHFDDLPTNGFEIFVLEGHVEKQKWVPMRLIPRLPSYPEKYSFGFIDEEELIFYSPEFNVNSVTGFRLCRYDLEKGSWTVTRLAELQKKIDGSARYNMRFYSYVNTLEPLKPLCE